MFCDRGRLTDQRGQEDEREQTGGEGAERRRGAPSSAGPAPARAGSGRPARTTVELRRLPERAEREEREDEDDRAAPEEEPLGNGQVLDAADPMGEQAQGRTSSSAIWTPVFSSSISNRPGASAVKRIVAGAPGATSAHQVVAVEVHLVRDVRGDGEDDCRCRGRRTRARSLPGARHRRPRRRPARAQVPPRWSSPAAPRSSRAAPRSWSSPVVVTAVVVDAASLSSPGRSAK